MDRTTAGRQPCHRRTAQTAILLREIAQIPLQAQNNHDEAPHDG